MAGQSGMFIAETLVPYAPWERSVLVFRVFVTGFGLVANLAALLIMTMSGTLKSLDARINLNIIIPKTLEALVFFVGDCINLYHNSFALGFVACQVYGFIFSLSEVMTLMTLLVLAHWHEAMVKSAGREIMTSKTLSWVLAGLWIYGIFCVSFPFWPGDVSDPYEMRPAKWACQWKSESSKPNMIFWITFSVAGIILTPLQILLTYRRIDNLISNIMSEVSAETETAGFSNASQPTMARSALKQLARRPRLISFMYIGLFWFTSGEFAYALVSRRPPPQIANMMTNMLIASLSAVTPFIFLSQDTRSLRFLAQKLLGAPVTPRSSTSTRRSAISKNKSGGAASDGVNSAGSIALSGKAHLTNTVGKPAPRESRPLSSISGKSHNTDESIQTSS